MFWIIYLVGCIGSFILGIIYFRRHFDIRVSEMCVLFIMSLSSFFCFCAFLLLYVWEIIADFLRRHANMDKVIFKEKTK